jgi:hypothetical protein
MPRHIYGPDHAQTTPLAPGMLHVVVVVSNPIRWVSRIQLAREFLARMRAAGVHLTLVEHAFGIRPFELQDEAVDVYVPVRGGDNSELWLKESLINVGVRHLPRDWRFMAWIDADVNHQNPDWPTETLHALQHWPVVQTWSQCVDLNQHHEPIRDESGLMLNKSFGKAWVDGDLDAYDERHPTHPQGFSPYVRAHVGYAWAIRREAYEGVGGLISWVPTGAADWLMAMGFTGRLTPNPARSEGFNRKLLAFQERCDDHVQRSVGYVDGLLTHYWHGSKKRRAYVGRDAMLQRTGFDPERDLVFDSNGIPELTGKNYKLRDFLRRYFRSRDEDSRGIVLDS